MLSLMTAAIAPALALLCFFYLKDNFEQEPVHMVIRCFLFGAILVFPIMFIQFAFQEEGVITNLLLETIILSALTEEFFKWFIVVIAVFHHVHFNQRYDGIVYASAVALGFASAENVFYLLANGLETAFLRAVFPVSSHALFGVVMGYYLGKAKFYPQKRYRYFAYSLIFPLILHGLYNLILLTHQQWHYLLIPFMIFLWFLGLWKVKKANQTQATYFHNAAS